MREEVEVLLSDIEVAFDYDRPEQSGGDSREVDDHDRILSGKTRETLTRSDIGAAGEVIATCSIENYIYWFPCLARFALSEPDNRSPWYAKIACFELTSPERVEGLVKHLTEFQFDLIAQMFTLIIQVYPEYLDEDDMREFEDAAAFWNSFVD